MGIARHVRIFGLAALGMVALTGVGRAQWQEFNPGSQADQIYRSGNVAIGTSGTPLAKLDLGGDLSMNSSRIALRGASFTSDFIRFSGTLFGLTNVNHWSYTGNIIFHQGPSNRATLTLTSDGNMLLGKLVGTPLPTQRLELATGNMLLTNGSGSTDGNIYLGGQPEFGNNGMRLYGGLVNGIDQAGFIDVKSGVTTDGLRFRVDNANGSTERMRITAGGNIGIANNDPKATLQIGNRMMFVNGIDKTIGYNLMYQSGDKRAYEDYSAAMGFTSAGDIFFRTAPYSFKETEINWTNALHIKNNGRIGVGMTSPVFQLDVMGDNDGGNFVAKRRAVVGVTNGGSATGMRVGVQGTANGTGTGAVYGVYGSTSGSDNATSYAAVYANGNLTYTGTLSQTSDAKLKENVKPIEGALSKIMQLEPKTYSYKQSGEFADMNLARGTQFGFIAQDVEKVFPELVTVNRHVSPTTPDAEGVTYKGVNYVGIVPVLAQAVREQEGTIQSQAAEIATAKSDISAAKGEIAGLTSEQADMKKQIGDVIADNGDIKRQVTDLVDENSNLKKQISNLTDVVNHLKDRLDSLVNANQTSGLTNDDHVSAPSSMLGQNKPNPFSDETTINYTVPSGVKRAELVVTDMSGVEVRRISLGGRGQSSVNVNVKGMPAGTYVYSLVTDGKIVDSDKMVVVK